MLNSFRLGNYFSPGLTSLDQKPLKFDCVIPIATKTS